MRLRRPSSPDRTAAPESAELEAVRAALADPTSGPEMRALMSIGARREARDRHALSVLLCATLGRASDTIDVGAHSGAVLREIVRIAPDGRHLAYEPIPELASRLQTEFPGVQVRNAALSNENGEARFVQVDSAPEFSGFRERNYDGLGTVEKHDITVRTERLDDTLPEGLTPRLIKIDVEGAEMLVLRGAAETIARHRPSILFEHGIGAADRYGTGPRELHEFLVDDLGMRIFDLDGVGPYDQQRFEDVFAEPLWNFLAVP